MPAFETPVAPNGVRPILVLIVGQRGSGKSTLASVLLPGCAPAQETVLLDPQGTLSATLGIQRHNPALTDDALEATLSPYLEKAEEEGQGKFFVFDEFDLYCNQFGYLGGRDGALYRLINVARGWGCGTLAIARGSAQTAKNYIANADLLFVSRTNEPNALKYLRELLGDELDYETILRSLKDHVFMMWSPHTGFGGFWIVRDGELCQATEQDLGIASPGTEGPPPTSAEGAASSSTTGEGPGPASADSANTRSDSRTPASTRPK